MSVEMPVTVHKPKSNENVKAITDLDHSEKMMKSMNNLRAGSKFCDVKIKVKDTEFQCHRLILAGASSQLAKMLHYIEYNEVLEINSIETDTMISVLDFVYTGNVNISVNNARDIFVASEFLQISFLKNAALEILESSIDVPNCLQLYTLAQLFKCSDLERKSFIFAQQNFNKVWHSSDFLELTQQQLVSFLSADEIRMVMDEQFVFFAAQRWCSVRAKKDTSDLLSVMETVRFRLMEPYFLRNCCELFPILKLCPEVMELIEKAKVSQKEANSPEKRSRVSTLPTQQSQTDSAVEVLLLVVGEFEETLPSFYCYRTETNQWFQIREFPFPFMARSVVTWEDQVFILGRKIGNSFDEIIQFNETLNEWKNISLSTRKRKYVSGIVAYNHSIYAIGTSCEEYYKTKSAETVERFDLKSNSWSEVGHLDYAINNTTAIASNQRLYIAGGGDALIVYDFFTEFNLATNTYTALTSSLTARERANGCVLDNFIYFIGGTEISFDLLNDVERYDINTNCWETVAPLIEARHKHSTAVKDGKIFVVGGYDNVEDQYAFPLHSVECYDPSVNKWEIVSEIPNNLQAFCCTTFKVKNHF